VRPLERQHGDFFQQRQQQFAAQDESEQDRDDNEKFLVNGCRPPCVSNGVDALKCCDDVLKRPTLAQVSPQGNAVFFHGQVFMRRGGFPGSRSAVLFVIFYQANQKAMRELNPLYNQIKDLKARLGGLRGYL
jgi:hypothetical protein